MSVAVGSDRHRVVQVIMMLVIVAMSMLVFHGVMLMIVRVHLGQVDEDAQEHQEGARQHPETSDTLAQHNGEERTDKGCKGEHGAGAGRTKRTLRQQVKTQTQTIAGATDQ